MSMMIQPYRFAQALPGERWWRVRFPVNIAGSARANGGGNYLDIRYINIATVEGQPNLVPSNTGYDGNPSAAGVPNVYLDNSSLWNNQGIETVADHSWLAFKLPTNEDMNFIQIRNHNQSGSYSPFDVIFESSYDGLTWKFEWGEARLSWGGAELKTFRRPNIDWTTYTSRDWLVQAYKSTGYDNLGILEMEMAETPGGADMCNGGTPRSTNNGTYPASNLTDNNPNSLTGSNIQARKAYVGYSFPNPVKVNEVRFNSLATEQMDWGALCVGMGTPGTFSGPWYIKCESPGITPQPWGQQHAIDYRTGVTYSPNLPHRYWRLRMDQRSIGNEAVLFGLTAIDFKNNDVVISTGGTPMASNSYDGNSGPVNAFDGNNATRWISTNVNMYQWIGYDFGAAVKPDAVTIVSNFETGYWGRMPMRVIVEWSDDGVNWKTFRGLNTSTYTGTLESQTFSLK